MFTNKNKLIGFIALIVVIVLVASTAIALIADNANKKATAEAEKKIEELQTALDAAKAGLEQAKSDLAALQGKHDTTASALDEAEAKIEVYEDIIAKWETATPDVHENLTALTAEYNATMAGEAFLPENALDGLEDQYWDAYYAIIRGIDGEEVLNSFKETTGAVNAQRYDSILKEMIENVKADGVTFPEDSTATEEAQEYYDSFSERQDVMDAFAAAGLDAALAELWATLDADEEADLAAAFVAAVEAIEEPIVLTTDVTAAQAAWEALNAALEPEDTLLTDNTDVVNARAALDVYEARLTELEAAKAEADVLNAQIAAIAGAAKADVATRDALEQLEADIEAWETTYHIDEANRPMVNDTADLHTAYETALAELKAQYDAFKAAVEAIGDVTVESGAAIDAAYAAHEAITNVAEADELLGTTTPDTVGELYAKLEAAKAEYVELMALIEEIRALIDTLYAADPAVSTNDVAGLNAKVDQLVALGFEVEVLNTATVDYVDKLAVVRLIPLKNQALNVINQAYNELAASAANREEIVNLASWNEYLMATANGLKDAEEIEKYHVLDEVKAMFDKTTLAPSTEK